jgi:hypothetical protein
MTARFKPSGRRNRLPNKTQQHIESKELAMVDPNAYKARCKVELSSYRKVQTATDVVMLGQTAINSLIADSDGDVLDIKKATALGYLMAIQLTAIKMAKSEQQASDGLSEKVHDTNEINMTTEEMKVLVFATNSNIQLNVINRAADRVDKLPVDFVEMDDQPQMLRTAIINAVNDANGFERKEEEEDNSPTIPPIPDLNEEDEAQDNIFESNKRQ